MATCAATTKCGSSKAAFGSEGSQPYIAAETTSPESSPSGCHRRACAPGIGPSPPAPPGSKRFRTPRHLSWEQPLEKHQRTSHKIIRTGEFLRLAPAELLGLGPAAPGCRSPRNRSTVRLRMSETEIPGMLRSSSRGWLRTLGRASQAPQLDRRRQHRAIRYGALLHAGGYQGRARMAVDVDHGYLLGVTRAGPASPS